MSLSLRPAQSLSHRLASLSSALNLKADAPGGVIPIPVPSCWLAALLQWGCRIPSPTEDIFHQKLPFDLRKPMPQCSISSPLNCRNENDLTPGRSHKSIAKKADGIQRPSVAYSILLHSHPVPAVLECISRRHQFIHMEDKCLLSLQSFIVGHFVCTYGKSFLGSLCYAPPVEAPGLPVWPFMAFATFLYPSCSLTPEGR